MPLVLDWVDPSATRVGVLAGLMASGPPAERATTLFHGSGRGCRGLPTAPLPRLQSASRADPLKDVRLRLRVALWPDRGYVSIDNCRVWCFKEHQRHAAACASIKNDLDVRFG